MEQIKKMRSFHNHIKKIIISRISSRFINPVLLDIGVGRGGDIIKWHNASIQNVVGIDIDDSYIKESINRYLNSIHAIKKRNYKFYKYDGVNIYKFLENNNLFTKYDIISCQFTVHYFFKDENTLDTFLQNISDLLNVNGHFIGTAMDGELVHKFLNCKEKNNVIFIHKNYDDIKQIGDEIKVHMNGTLYFQEKSISTEYLIFGGFFRDRCLKFGLVLEDFKNFKDYFYDKTNNISIEDKDTLQTSFLNFSFCFRKIALSST